MSLKKQMPLSLIIDMIRPGLVLALTTLLSVSCAEHYHIVGSTALEGGQQVQLRQRMPVQDIAQANIVHGRFEFEGVFDSVSIVDLYIDGNLIVPIVLERDLCSIHLAPMEQQVNGGVLNTKLSKFMANKRRLCHRLQGLQMKLAHLEEAHQEHTSAYRSASKDFAQLRRQLQELEVKFVVDNQSNILGAYYFSTVVSAHCPLRANQLPLLQQMLHKVSPQFRNRPVVARALLLYPELHTTQ